MRLFLLLRYGFLFLIFIMFTIDIYTYVTVFQIQRHDAFVLEFDVSKWTILYVI